MKVAIILVTSYISTQIIADIATLKVAWVAGMSVNAGLFSYPLTFTLRDLVHKHLGRESARLLIVLAAIVNVIMVLYLGFAAALPPDPVAGSQTAFSEVFGPVWRIVFASIIAEVFSELLDTEVYHLWVTRITQRYQWARVFASNAVSAPLDGIIFSALAFGGVLPFWTLAQQLAQGLAVEALLTVFGAPLIYLVGGGPRRGEVHSSAA